MLGHVAAIENGLPVNETSPTHPVFKSNIINTLVPKFT